jgi:hypothetical protein
MLVTMLRTLRASLVILFAGCLGCGSGDGLELVPVRGQVRVGTLPLATGTVSFRPDSAKGNQSQHHPTGVIDAQGNYELTTIGRKGAPPGWYRVLVFADANAASAGSAAHPLPPIWLVHAKYTNPNTTDLVVEVVAKAGPGAYDLTLSK